MIFESEAFKAFQNHGGGGMNLRYGQTDRDPKLYTKERTFEFDDIRNILAEHDFYCQGCKVRWN